jgi:hypothetical protein
MSRSSPIAFVAVAAYWAPVERRPKDKITLRQGIRVAVKNGSRRNRKSIEATLTEYLPAESLTGGGALIRVECMDVLPPAHYA